MITIMGATGNIGTKLTAALLARGQRVRAIARASAKLDQLGKLGAEIAAIDATDAKGLTDAFRGSSAVFTLIPPQYDAADFGAHYAKVSEAIVQAVRDSGVTKVVNLSSFGAEHAGGTGPIKHLHAHELRLNALAAVDVLHLRPTYFLENLLMQTPFIQSHGIMGGAIRGDARFAMIATQDIAERAAERLAKLQFSGKSVEPLLGAADVTFEEAAVAVSEKLGRKIPYVTFDGPSTITALTGLGLSESTAREFVEMSEALNSGLIASAGRRTRENTTGTGLREFVSAAF